jgi:hypothetical protein
VRRELVVLAVALLSLVACDRGGDSARVSLDGSPRIADDEGIVTAVDLSSITLDGTRTYTVEDDLVSFSNIDLQPVPLLYTDGQYVQIGADGHTARWIATLAKPLPLDPPVVLYSGVVRSVDDGRLVFANGTVLELARGVDARGVDGKRVDVRLQPATRRVTEVEAR